MLMILWNRRYFKCIKKISLGEISEFMDHGHRGHKVYKYIANLWA